MIQAVLPWLWQMISCGERRLFWSLFSICKVK
jgi:hypothetical protein